MVPTTVSVTIEQLQWMDEHDNGSEAVRNAIDYYREHAGDDE